jgi:hypothetical protein
MNTSYDNILIPIEHSLITQKAVARGIELAKPWQSTIHLVYLLRSWNPISMLNPASSYEIMLQYRLDSYLKALINLMHWIDIIQKSCPGAGVRIHIKMGFSLQFIIFQTIQKVHAGVTIIASTSTKKWLSLRSKISANLLAQKTGSDILAIKTDLRSEQVEEVETLFNHQINRRNRTSIGRFTGISINSLYNFLSRN